MNYMRKQEVHCIKTRSTPAFFPFITVKWPIFQFNHQKQGLYSSVPVPCLLKMASKANSCPSLANGPRSMILYL